MPDRFLTAGAAGTPVSRRRFAPPLPLLAFGCAALFCTEAALASGPELAPLVPGAVALEVAGSLPSHLDISPHLVAEAVCGRPTDGNGGAGEIGLTVSNEGPPKPPPFIIQILDGQASVEEAVATVSPSRLALVGPVPLATDCGAWAYTVGLDEDAVQPLSTLTLYRAAAEEQTAPFSGTLAAAAVLRLVSADGEVRTLPLPLTFEMTGRYTLAPPDSAGDSNLVLFVERTAAGWGALPAVVSGGCGGGLCRGGHRLVLEAAPRSLLALPAVP